MSLKWPASHLLATSLSMVGAGKNPALGIGVAGDMGCQPTGMWRGLRQIGSARKGFGGRWKIVGKDNGDGSIPIAESAGTEGRRSSSSLPLGDSEAGQLKLLLEIRNNPGSFTPGTLRTRGAGFEALRSWELLVDGTVWSPKRHSRCLYATCTYKDPTSFSRGRRKMLSSFCPSVTFINNQKPGGQLFCVTESRDTSVATSPLYAPPGKQTWRVVRSIGNGTSGQRRLSYFKSDNLRWRKSYFRFKVFSEGVDSREAVFNDLRNEEHSWESSIEEALTGKPADFEDRGGRALDGLAESTGRGVQENEFLPSEEEQVDKTGRVLDILQKNRLDAVSVAVNPGDVTVICFDIETTGLHPAYHRIIEFAARDLAGGEYSTIQTLVNPDREVPLESERIHKISSKMVNNPDVPRWKDVALAIVRFVQSRRKGQGPVILVAHNGKRFDVPFIMKEFRDCGIPVPSYWRFADSMPLARSAMKSLGQKRPKVALTDLFNYYNLHWVGDAHRAMADVNMLAPVLQMVMNDLSMGVQELLEQSFSVEDLMDKGNVLPVNDVPAIEEIYDGVEMDGLETAVASEVLETFNVEAAPQSYEAALGIQTSDEAGGTLRGTLVPWDSLTDNPYVQTANEFEKNLGLTLGNVQKISLNQPIIEMEEERLVHERSRLLDLPEKHEDIFQSECDVLSKESSNLRSEHVVTHHREQDQIPAEGTTIVENRYDSELSNTWEEMSSSVEGEKSIRSVDANGRTDRGKGVDLIPEDQVESLGEQSSEWQTGSNGSVWDSVEILTFPNLLEGDDAPLLTSTVDVSLLSPMMRHYVETKRQRDPKFLLLSQVGDFYEAFFEDAERLAEACNLRLTAKDGGKLLRRKIPMAGVPVQHIEKNLHTLLGKGIPVVRQEQVGDEENGVAIERRVTAVLTPGTLVDGSMLEESFNNFLVAIMPPSGDDGTWGLAFSDISTGEFRATELQGKEAFVQELLRLQPAEILFPVRSSEEIDVDSPAPIGLPSQFCYSSRPHTEFSRAETEKKLQLHYGEVPVNAMGVASFPCASRAAGGLLRYVQETQQIAIEDIPLQKLKYYSANDSMHLSETVRKHLEMTTTSRWGKAEGSFVWAVDDTRTAMGRRMLQKWLLWPLLQKKKINERQDAVEVFVKHSETRKALRSELERLGDLERLTGRVGWKRATARDMLSVAQSLQALPKLAEVVEGISSNPYITAVLKIPFAAIEIADRVQGMLVEESGAKVPGELIKSGVDTVLDELRKDVERVHESISLYEKQEQARTGIASLEVGYTKLLGRFISIRKTRLKDWSLPEDYQSLQRLKIEERFTTPALQEYERLRLEAVKKAVEREEYLFLMLKDEMSARLEPVQEYSKALAEVDVLCSFAEIAVKRSYCRPEIMEAGREVTIVKGRHPVVERCLPEGVNFVPNSTYLGYSVESNGSNGPKFASPESAQPVNEAQIEGIAIAEASRRKGLEEMENLTCDERESFWPRPDVMILTGPNASGKSCYLRQIGLIQILGQAGCFVPARECRLSISDGLYTRVGSVDDLAAGQSTFKVEMSETAAILEKATPHSLVLLDEVGRGTGSQEGEMIARAIVEYLAQQVKARTVFSTHYHEVHDIDLELENVSNYHLEALETSSGDIVFDHTVRPGYALKSYAVGVARASGMPEWVCNRATELLAELTVADGREDKMAGSTALGDYRTERQSTREFPDTHLPELSSEDENQSGTLVASTGGNTSTSGTNDSWFEVMKFSKRGKSKQTRARKNSYTEEIDLNHLDDNECSGVPGSAGAQAEEAEYEGIELHEEASSGIEEGTSDSDLIPKIIPVVDCGVSDLPEDDLIDIWSCVCAALQNRPATQALTKQKGILISVTRYPEATRVRMGASALFVKKFQQHEHASALEAAFTAVLKQPVKLDVSILDTSDKRQ